MLETKVMSFSRNTLQQYTRMHVQTRSKLAGTDGVQSIPSCLGCRAGFQLLAELGELFRGHLRDHRTEALPHLLLRTRKKES